MYDSKGRLIYWNPDRYLDYQNRGNSINYKKVDLKQNGRTHIVIELITGKLLTTVRDKEVVIL